MDFLDELITEQPNPLSIGIDIKSTEEILRIINAEDQKVSLAVEKEITSISRVVNAVVKAFKRGGRLIYVGAGTSGRLGVLDAAECPPTYGTDPQMVQGIIAGGKEAMFRSIEWAEDRESDGRQAILEKQVDSRDVVLGITASGQAPFVLGAMKQARENGAKVVALSCNRNSLTYQLANYKVFVDVGPEIVAGSTRMKAGTAQKLVLNMITTASMIRLGKVYNNLMVDLIPVNNKLVSRSKRLIKLATGCSEEEAEKAFAQSGKRPKTAIVMVLLGVSREKAQTLLQENDGRIGLVMQTFKHKSEKFYMRGIPESAR